MNNKQLDINFKKYTMEWLYNNELTTRSYSLDSEYIEIEEYLVKNIDRNMIKKYYNDFCFLDIWDKVNKNNYDELKSIIEKDLFSDLNIVVDTLHYINKNSLNDFFNYTNEDFIYEEDNNIRVKKINTILFSKNRIKLLIKIDSSKIDTIELYISEMLNKYIEQTSKIKDLWGYVDLNEDGSFHIREEGITFFKKIQKEKDTLGILNDDLEKFSSLVAASK